MTLLTTVPLPVEPGSARNCTELPSAARWVTTALPSPLTTVLPGKRIEPVAGNWKGDGMAAVIASVGFGPLWVTAAVTVSLVGLVRTNTGMVTSLPPAETVMLVLTRLLPVTLYWKVVAAGGTVSVLLSPTKIGKKDESRVTVMPEPTLFSS